jgi:2,4-dienoyl-CoA reductase-like NADH-dependent reductase (Old Yellow Enzyme family)
MAPLTRNRAVPPGMVPSPLAVDYYGQRASAGLLITEASQVSQQGQGYQDTPGIYSKEQVAGWRKVTDRVHERGGRIFIQIWHVGRISHTSLQPGGGKPVAPSAIRAKGKTFVNGTFTDISEPRALELGNSRDHRDFKRGTENALAAGFDGVEIHGANGYLLDQFAKDGTNKRTDAYGGSIENRAKLMLEVSKVVAAEAGPRADRHPHLAGDAGQRRLRLQSAAAVRSHRRSAQRAEADLHPRHRRRDRRPARHRAVRLRLPAQALQAAPMSPTTAMISISRPRCSRPTRPT